MYTESPIFSGPFVSALANRYGFRLVAILGSVISCIAFVLSYFSTSIEFLYVSYGVIGKFLQPCCRSPRRQTWRREFPVPLANFFLALSRDASRREFSLAGDFA